MEQVKDQTVNDNQSEISYQNSVQGLQGLKASYITELKSLANPPQLIKDILGVCFRVLQNDQNLDIGWAKQKKLLGQYQVVLKQLIEFNPHNLSPQMVEYLNQQSFDRDRARKTSIVIAAFNEWLESVKELQV